MPLRRPHRKLAAMMTLASVLDRAARFYCDRPAIIDAEGRYTWREFVDRVARAADVLRSLGVERGGRFAILSRNTFRHAELMHAGYWMGATPVPINYRLAPQEIADILEDSGCTTVAAEDHFAEVMMADALRRWSANVLLVSPEKDTGKAGGDWPHYEAALSEAEPAAMYVSAEEDDALLLYTGGTTGRSKGVRLSHRNVVANALQTGLVFGPREDDVYLHIPPMFHAADLPSTCFTMAGAAHVYLPAFTAKAALEAIQRYQVTVVQMLPTMLIMTMQEPGLEHIDTDSLRMIFYGSSPLAAEWIERILKAFEGIAVIGTYGLTETAPILTALPMAEHMRALQTGDLDILRGCGRPLQGVDLRIVDQDGAEVETGQAGEVTVRGPNVFEGYLDRPEATAAALKDGWFHTGDIGRYDGRGYLTLLDRKKDMIVTGGENVYSGEVEAALHQNPKVHECAVVGVPDDTYGEALLAAVVPAPGATLSEAELIAHCRTLIGGYKVPRRYVFLEALPRSAMNKVLKSELRQTYGSA
jgi:long-chain acyl-CoA synthetase